MRAAGRVERVGDAVGVEELREFLVWREEAVLGAAANPQQFQRAVHLLRISHHLLELALSCGSARHRRTEAADAAEQIEAAQADIQCLTAAHREAHERSMFTIA